MSGGPGMAREMWRALETLHIDRLLGPGPRDAYRRAIPDAWEFAPPATVLKARFAGAGAALGRLLGAWAGSPEAAEAATRLLTLLDQPVRLVVEGGSIPFPNPVGLPAPSA